ncbi:MAG: hypothetical protein ACFFDN_49450 [Candidatus Hodarchaeota archaeon]
MKSLRKSEFMMMKKKKVKELIRKALKADDLEQINKLLLEYPSMIDEFPSELNLYPDLAIDDAVIAGVGVMEDELAGPVRVEDVVKSVIVDFRKNLNEIELFSILDKIERQGFIQKRGIGWVLTIKGSEVCDQTLSQLG